jgi:uncharacterized membrane protein
MAGFRGLLVIMWMALLAYTAVVVGRHGLDYVTPFVTDIAAFSWAGQFNADFLGFLILAGLWTAWRHRFSAAGVGLGLAAANLGMAFLAPYLLIAIARAGGDMRIMLLGPARA